MSDTKTTALAKVEEAKVEVVNNTAEIGFGSLAGFQALQRMGKAFMASTLVPERFRLDPAKGGSDTMEKMGNTMIALEMALRMKANPLMVMQNLYVVHGSPSWSAKFLVATLNGTGRYTSLRYEFQGKPGQDDWGCRAWAVETETGEKLTGPLVTIGLAKKEGWFTKNGSKWQTMPEMMLRYRAASWFVSTYCPEIAMGLRTVDENREIGPEVTAAEALPPNPEGKKALKALLDAEEATVETPAEAPAPAKTDTAPAAESPARAAEATSERPAATEEGNTQPAPATTQKSPEAQKPVKAPRPSAEARLRAPVSAPPKTVGMPDDLKAIL